MVHPIPRQQNFKPNTETKSPILNQIFNNIERYRQTARSPIASNSKAAKSVSVFKDPQKINKNLRNSQLNTIVKPMERQLRDQKVTTKNSNSFCRTFARATKPNPGTFDNDFIKRQENLLLQIYNSLETNHRKRGSAEAEINSEYERLQRKYCPKFKLANRTNINQAFKQGFGEIKQNARKAPAVVLNTRKSSQKPILAQQKSQWNFKQNIESNKPINNNCLKALEKETVLKIENFNKVAETTKKLDKQDDSDKTLTPQELSVIQINNIDSAIKKEVKIEEYPSMDKYRVGPSKPKNLKTSYFHNSLKILMNDEIKYPQLQQIFYHQAVPHPPTISYNLKNKLEHLNLEIRQAIILGKSPDATTNKLLANAIEKALNEKFSWSTIHSVIKNIKNYNSKQKVLHLLQIQLRQRVFILCTVRTCNFSHLLSMLDKVMHPVRAQFAPVLQHFCHCCVIEAVVPPKYLQLNPKQYRQNLDCDAKVLKVRKIDVVDEVRGEVSVQCLPVAMPNTTKFMESLGYKILSSDYGFRANKEIILDTRTGVEYRKLINNLLQIPDIETISDNVIY